jgi:Uncharacterized conserved protein
LKKIVLVNAHWNNRGDEAALRAIIDGILENTENVHITIIFKDKGNIVQFPYKEQVDYVTARYLPEYMQMRLAIFSQGKIGCDLEMRKVINTIEHADLVVYAPGGAVVSDRFWWKKQLEYLFPIAYAQKKHIPVFFAAPSIGPFSKTYKYRNRVLKRVDAICVRESISYQELKKEGLEKNVTVTIDSAFLNDISKTQMEKEMKNETALCAFLNNYQKVIGVTITDFAWHVEYGKDNKLKGQIKRTFQEFIQLLGKRRIGVVLIPQLFGNQNDKKYLQEFEWENTYLLGDDKDAYFQQYMISKLYGVIGMRYHSNIFAAKMGVPFIPIVYEEKMRGFVEYAGWENLAIALENLSVEELCRQYEYMETNYTDLCKIVWNERTKWKKQAQRTLNDLLQLL